MWVVEDPLMVPLSSDEGTGHTSRSRRVVLQKIVTVEGRGDAGPSVAHDQRRASLHTSAMAKG